MTKRPIRSRSAVTNGTRLHLRPVDGRGEFARRFADLLAEVEAELGGLANMTVTQKAAARAFAQMCVEREVMEMKRAGGEAINVDEYGTLCDRIDRQGRRLQPAKSEPRRPPASLKAILGNRPNGAR